jgi:hypothetical protein
MPATTTKTKTNPITPSESLLRVSRQLVAQAAADWRTWAIAVANGESAPDGRDLLAAAAALEIEHPAAALQADADAILEVRTAEDCIEKCRRATDDLLDPWGGSLDKLASAIADAKREVERLTEIHGNAAGGCSRSFWVDLSHRLRVGHPRVWSNYNEKGL